MGAIKTQPAVPPPVDLPDKPFLGFGSKGQNAGSRQTAPTSYNSWSESVDREPRAKRQASPGRAVQIALPSHSAQRPQSKDYRRQDVIENQQRSSAHESLSRPTGSPERGTRVRSRRATGPAVEVYGPHDERTRQRHRRSTTRTTVQSLPHGLPSEPPEILSLHAVSYTHLTLPTKRIV